MPFGNPPRWNKARREALKKSPKASETTPADDDSVSTGEESKAFENAMRTIIDLEHGTPAGRDYTEVVEDTNTPESADRLLTTLSRSSPAASQHEETPNETRSRLKTIVERLGLKKGSPHDELILTERQTLVDIDLAFTQAYKEREKRAEQFAEKYSITDIREALLLAEREYTDAVRDLKARFVRMPFNGVAGDIREKYDTAALTWRKAVFAAVETAPKKEKQRATIISFRDTVMRAEEARQRGTLEASTLREQTLYGKTVNRGLDGLSTIVSGYLGVTKKAGTLGAFAHTKAREYMGKEGISEEQLVERYTRASRIVSSALLGTLVMGSVGTAGVATSVLFRAVRGTLGLSIGSVAGVYSGKAYRKTAGSLLRGISRDTKRGQQTSTNNLDNERLSHRLGSGKALAMQTRVAEVLGALLGGASTSLLSNVTLHEMASLKGVQEAQETLERVSPTQSSIDSNASEEAPMASAPRVATTHVPGAEAVYRGHIQVEVTRGEGADKLISDLQERLRVQYPDIKTAPENIQALLQHSPHKTAELLGLGHESGGVMLHPGDTVGVDDHGRLVFHDNVHERNRIIINEKHELHPLKGHAVKQIVTEHKAPISHEHVQHPRLHKESFDAKADHEAVARANREEFAREQQGQFGPATSIEQTLPKPLSDATTVPALAGPSGTLGDYSDTPDGQAIATSIPQPEAIQVASSIPLEKPQGVIAVKPPLGPTTVDSKVGGITTLGDFAPETPTVALELLNPFGLFIDSKIPHIYVTENQGVSVFGGSLRVGRLIAEEYAKAHPGVEVTFEVQGVDGLGNQVRYAGEVSADASGKLSVDIPDPKLEAVPPPPDPKTFTEVKP